MTHVTLLARINAGSGKFPFVTVKFSKNHRPVVVENSTYYLRRSNGDRTPIIVRKDLEAAFAAMLNFDKQGSANGFAARAAVRPIAASRPSIAEAAETYINRSKEKSPKTISFSPHPQRES